MQDIELYRQILGLQEPWSIQSVQLRAKEREVLLKVQCQEQVWACPHPGCAQRMHIHQWESRRWRHLDTCQFQTIIEAPVPRVKCPDHGTISVAVPWAEKFSRFSRLFERFAIDVLRECSIKAAADLLAISWDEADGIKQRAVARGLERKPKVLPQRLCVDEKSAARGQTYLTVVAAVDGEQTTVEYVAPGRSQESLDPYWQQFTPEERAGVQAVAMDLWEPFINSTLEHVPQAPEKITHDPYHLVAHMNQAVNDVRKAEHRELLGQGDDTLAGTRQMWLYGQENLPERHLQDFDRVKALNLRTARAWSLKEVFRTFWQAPTRPTARRYFDRWYSWAVRSRLGPVKKVARMCKERLAQILNFFDHRITNGPLEGLNNKLQALIKKAYGYRNPQRFITDIFFHCGGLDLYPDQ
jgi:transposase